MSETQSKQDLKLEIRDKVRQQREQLTQAQRNSCSHRAAQLIDNHPYVRHGQTVGCYLAQDGELDLRSIIRKLWHQRKSVWLPVIDSKKERTLMFYQYTPSTQLKNNQYGISEPKRRNNTKIDLHHLDVVLVPLVAFDDNLNRLGMGGGFYDMTFKFIKENKNAETKLLGVAYDFQKISQVPVEDWDLPLDDVIVLSTTTAECKS